MRSQVQVLAGPPTIVAGHSGPSTEPGALAASLGRAGAAHPIPAGTSSGPPGPPTRPSGSATTTHRGRAPSPRTAATRRMQPPRAAACSRAHSAAARDGRSARRPGLPGSLRGQARPPRARTNPTARVRHRPPTDQLDFGSVARFPASSTVDRAVDGPAATGASTHPGGHGRPATSTWSPTPPPEHGRIRTRPDGRGQTPDGWTLDGWTADGRAPDPLDDDTR
jgi:hypothetical protein